MHDFLSESQDLFKYTQSLRRDFHMHPELGFQEFRTAGIVAKELTDLGLEVVTGVGGTGVVTLIEGERAGPVVLVRADMDALPITEETGAPYASVNPGVMHACGHDSHTAVLLTLAKLLNKYKEEIGGTVKLIFQPAEEGLGGAQKMITDGVLEDPKVDVAIALHVWNEQPLGWIGIPDGPAMAGGEIFKIRLIGKGGHGAAPHLAIDPIHAAAQMVIALQEIVSRNTPPLKPAVVSVCTIHGGETFNVIPTAVELTGTIRTFEKDIRDSIYSRFNQIVRSVADGTGCKVEIDLQQLAPAVINDGHTAAIVQKTAHRLFPTAVIENSNYATMGSEDMADIMEKVPGCFILMGSANPSKHLDASHHHPKFDFDEDVLPQAAALLAESVFDILKDLNKDSNPK